MQLWADLQTATTTYASLSARATVFCVVLVGLYLFLPGERRRMRISACIFVLAVLGLLAAGAVPSFLSAEGITYVTIRCCALFLEAVAIITLGSTLLFAAILRSVHLEPPRIVQDLLVGATYLFVGIMLLSRNGLDVRGVVATSAVISAVIGFSLQDTLGNIMGGLALQLERTIQPGDWIRVDDLEGRVKQIRWRQTSLETRAWDTVVVPNSTLMKARVVLLGQRTGAPIQRRRMVTFNVDFRFPPGEVIQVVETALCAEAIANVAHTPPANCIVIDFKDSYASYGARYWLSDLSKPSSTDSLVRTRIYSALRRAGIRLSLPAQAVFLTQDDESRRKRKRQEELDARTAMLRRLSLFHSFTDEELTTLAAHLRNASFVRGEAMARQGTVAHSMYIIAEGTASVHLTMDEVNRQVATLQSGDYFGEMGLLTGAPRSATVIAESNVECLRIELSGLEGILQSRPELAEHITKTLSQRRTELEKVRAEITQETLQQHADHSESAILRRVRAFLGLDPHDGAKG